MSSGRAPAWLLACLAALASSVIGYEIALSRMFSFLLHYHYSFLIVSGAIFGLGLGALLVYRWTPETVRRVMELG